MTAFLGAFRARLDAFGARSNDVQTLQLRMSALRDRMAKLPTGPLRAKLGQEYNHLRARLKLLESAPARAAASAPPTPSPSTSEGVLAPLLGAATPLDSRIRALQKAVLAQDAQIRLYMRTKRTAALPGMQRARSATIEKLRSLWLERKQWRARNNTELSVKQAIRLRTATATSPQVQLKAGGAKLRSVGDALPPDPYATTVLTLAVAPRALRFYTTQYAKTHGVAKDYYRRRIEVARSILRAAAPHRRDATALRQEALRLRKLAANAKARRDYATNARLLQQIAHLEEQIRMAQVTVYQAPPATTTTPGARPAVVEWDATAPSELVADATPTALTFTQARSKALGPATAAAARVAEEDAAATDSSVDAEVEDAALEEVEVPWYKRFALPMALVAALGLGLAVMANKGKMGKAGSFKLLRRSGAPPSSPKAA